MNTTPSDDVLLASLDDKLQVIRDRIGGVAIGYNNGLYLFGEGGTSKSYTVENCLKQLNKPYKLTNTHLTGKGLFTVIRDYPDAIHVLEDAETLLRDKKAFGVLRSALWGQKGENGQQERVVTWQTAKEREEVVFTGGLIITANCPLDDIPELRAVKTRISYLEYSPTNEEVAALMRDIARKGHTHGSDSLSPEACLEVANEIAERSSRLKKNLDLRLLVNTFQDRLQFENGDAETHWIDLLESRMKERTVELVKTGIRAISKAQEIAILRQLSGLSPQERLGIWMKETGKSQPALYRRLKELANLDSQISHLPAISAGSEKSQSA